MHYDSNYFRQQIVNLRFEIDNLKKRIKALEEKPKKKRFKLFNNGSS